MHIFSVIGCLMVIAWIFLAPAGILMPRYYRYLFVPRKFFPNVDFWFAVHRPTMVSVAVISLVSFLIILSDLNWTWIDSSFTLIFVHSIFGIITIGLAFIQVSYAWL